MAGKAHHSFRRRTSSNKAPEPGLASHPDGESSSPQGPGARCSPGPVGPGAAKMSPPPAARKVDNVNVSSVRSQRSPAAPGLGPMSPNLQEQLQLMGVASMKAQIRPKDSSHAPSRLNRPLLTEDVHHGAPSRRLNLASGRGLADESLNEHLGITGPKAQSVQRRAALCRKAMRPYDMAEELDQEEDEDEDGVLTYSEGTEPLRSEERRDSEEKAEENVRELEDALRTCIGRLERLEGTKDRDEWRKQEAMMAGMNMVEEERKRGEEQCLVLVKRIEFLSEELDEARSQLETQRESYAELLEAAKELAEDKERARRPAPLFAFPGTSSAASKAPHNGSNTSMSAGRVCEIGGLCTNPFAFLWGGR